MHNYDMHDHEIKHPADYSSELPSDEPSPKPENTPSEVSERDILSTGAPEPPKNPPLIATFGLIGLLLLIYIASSYPHFSRINELAWAVGGLYPPAVLDGQIWRVFTAPLLHADWAHLFNNAFGIYIFGMLLEPSIGSRMMVAIFLFTALGSMLFPLLFTPEAVTIGASGIDYGLIGVYLTLVLLIRRKLNPQLYQQELRSAVIFILVYITWNQYQFPQASVWGHFGGLIFGILFALWFFKATYKARRYG